MKLELAVFVQPPHRPHRKAMELTTVDDGDRLGEARVLGRTNTDYVGFELGILIERAGFASRQNEPKLWVRWAECIEHDGELEAPLPFRIAENLLIELKAKDRSARDSMIDLLPKQSIGQPH